MFLAGLIAGVDLDIDVWMSPSELSQVWHENFTGKKWLHRDAQSTAHILTAVSECRPIEFVDQRLHFFEECGSRLG